MATGWGGELTVTCIKGALIPDVSTCLAACNANDVATNLQLGVDSESFNVPLSTLIAHGAAGTESLGFRVGKERKDALQVVRKRMLASMEVLQGAETSQSGYFVD